MNPKACAFACAPNDTHKPNVAQEVIPTLNAHNNQPPTIKTIRLYDFRHYFCTKTLRDSGDAFFTMNQMGHKKLTTTQLYMHLVNLDSDEWTCRAAATKDEAMSLIEGGFQYVTDMDGVKLFKKRK
jgi:hypothetical protein